MVYLIDNLPLFVSLHFFSKLAGVTSFQNVLETVREAKRLLGEILSSCEFIDQSSLDCVTTQLRLKSPIDNYPFYMLIETSGTFYYNLFTHYLI